MRLVLVTGAGASRNLGKDDPLPLMPDWCSRLCDALDAKESGLANAVGLSPGMNSQDFETALGEFLRWNEMRPLNDKFAGLGGPHAGHRYASGDVVVAQQRESERVDAIVESLKESLYREFGSARVDPEAAESAFKALVDQLPGLESIVAVTTNYDTSIERGLERLGQRPETGFTRGVSVSSRLAPDGLVDWDMNHGGVVPVLHLHGAVGWYSRDGDVIEHPGDQPYMAALGVPLVLYPDPNKDPTSDALVEVLWREFDKALDGATHVLVIGHSLNDDALVARLKGLDPAKTHLGVSARVDEDYFESKLDYERVRSRTRINEFLPDAHVIPCSFGPDPRFEKVSFQGWVEGEPPEVTAAHDAVFE